MKSGFCPKCGTEVSSEFAFCPKCGFKLPEIEHGPVEETTAVSTGAALICPTCGFVNSPRALSCESCGTSLKSVSRVSIEKAEQTGSEPQPERITRQESKDQLPKQKRDKTQKEKPQQNVRKKFHLEPFQVAVIVAAVFLGAVLTYGIMTSSKPSQSQQDDSSTQQAAGSTQPSADILQAIDRLRQVVDKNPSDLVSTLKLANMLQDNTFYDQAAIYYKRYLDKVPTNDDARVDYGVTLFEGGRTQDAIAQLNQAIKNNPKHQVAYFNLGIVYLNAQEIDKATDAFKKCVTIDPTTDIGKKAKQTLDEHMNIPNQQEVK
ncbi:MAG TPA: tetratricopeptide repeat protein [Candidatus Kryptonia bacterium]